MRVVSACAVLLAIAIFGGVEAKREIGPVHVHMPVDVTGSLQEDEAFRYVPNGGVVHHSWGFCDSGDFYGKRSIEVPGARRGMRAHSAVLRDAGWRRRGNFYEKQFGATTVSAGFQRLDDRNYRLVFSASLSLFGGCDSFNA